MGNRDARYDLIKPMLADGKIVSFADIFKYIPKTTVSNDLGKKVDRFNLLIREPWKFVVADLARLAQFCQIDPAEIITLVLHDYSKGSES